MIYLVAGLDHSTFSRWHDHVAATDATGAARIACSRAAIGPYCSVEPFLADVPPVARAGRLRPEAA